MEDEQSPMRAEMVRAALPAAERPHRRTELRTWAERVNADPAEAAAARLLTAELDAAALG